jgi:hypothetical protein
VKPNINLVEVHPQLRKNGHPVDGVVVGAGSPCPRRRVCFQTLPEFLVPSTWPPQKKKQPMETVSYIVLKAHIYYPRLMSDSTQIN